MKTEEDFIDDYEDLKDSEDNENNRSIPIKKSVKQMKKVELDFEYNRNYPVSPKKPIGMEEFKLKALELLEKIKSSSEKAESEFLIQNPSTERERLKNKVIENKINFEKAIRLIAR